MRFYYSSRKVTNTFTLLLLCLFQRQGKQLLLFLYASSEGEKEEHLCWEDNHTSTPFVSGFTERMLTFSPFWPLCPPAFFGGTKYVAICNDSGGNGWWTPPKITGPLHSTLVCKHNCSDLSIFTLIHNSSVPKSTWWIYNWVIAWNTNFYFLLVL